METNGSFQGKETMDFIELSKTTTTNESWKIQLDNLFALARKSFIYDNLVIYGPETESSSADVIYAKAVGRGKNAEADVTWGSSIVARVINEKKCIVETPPDLNQKDRLQQGYVLGLPVKVTATITSALIFIRFGGPAFSEMDLSFAEFLSNLVSSILRQKYLTTFAEMLETEKTTSKLQYDFVNTISHELRSPLGFIKGYTTTLLRDDAQWDRTTQIDFLQIIERESNNLTELIDNLLDSSRLQSGLMKFNVQAVRIDSLLRDEINRALIAEPGQIIELICENDTPTIQGDARRLTQVFDNLLSNARKYAPHSPIKIVVSKDHNFLIIQFSDKGPGISKSYLPKIFTRFFRVPENTLGAHGSGLGLSICKQIIELHHGKIEVDSSELGTTFVITLPIKIEDQTDPAEVI